MLILLPPSEGKALGRRGAPLDLARLSFPELQQQRDKTLDALAVASRRPDALDVLDAPKGAADRVAGNVHLRSAPCLPASQLYTGVLYDALDLASLDGAARRRASRWIVVVSALFGALRPGDRVPSYRLAMGVDLPGIGPLASAWRPALDPVLSAAAGRRAVVDLRSSTYAAAWRPSGAVAERTVAVHVVRDGPGGRTAVSHMAKHTRGLVARHLVVEGRDASTVDDVVDIISTRFTVAVDQPRSGRPRRLEVVEPS